MKTKNALIIDNNLIDLFVSRKILESHGISKIHCARNCKDALTHLQASSHKYHLIITDIYLPLMDGFEFADKFFELKLNNKHGEIFILTASVDPSHNQKAEQRNIKFIEKPLAMDKLK
jgi:CheY-like chemotaxis protein